MRRTIIFIICSQTISWMTLCMSRPIICIGSYLQVTWWALGQWKGKKIAMNDYNFYCYSPTYFTLSAINLTPKRLWLSARYMYSSFAWFVLVNQKENIHLDQAPVVQMLDSTIQQISIWDKYLGNQLLHYPLDRDFSIG